jgi:hypothetical protein
MSSTGFEPEDSCSGRRLYIQSSTRLLILMHVKHTKSFLYNCLFACVGPRKRVYCSLQAYCTYPMCVECSHFHRQEAPRHNDAKDPNSER